METLAPAACNLALGRDGSPSRPFADGGPYVDRLNGLW